MNLDFVLNIARKSPCTRRKYGAVIVDAEDSPIATGFNARVSTCCNGVCARDRLKAAHGSNTDIGGEIHAEQAALVEFDWRYPFKAMYIAGLDADDNPLKNFENRPCYSCARMIAYAGLTWIYIPIEKKWEPINIYDVMEDWEKKWEKVEENVGVSA